MLGLMTILGVSAFSTSSVNLKALSNVQARQEAIAAADQAAQQVLSSITFALSAPPYSTSVAVDVDNNGAADYQVAVVASCDTYRAYPEAGQILDPLDACVGSATLGAFCNQTRWDIQSHAVPASATSYRGNAGTDVVVHQGARIVMSLDKTSTACN